MENYYFLLGIYPGASNEEIRKAYLRKIKELHPDRFNDPDEKEKATREFALINEAYRILSDPNKRQEFEKTISTPPRKIFKRRRQDIHSIMALAS
uniref:J domain-containing protein n=1 Tax=candidate division WOR-3 bacterium TaxID=2052148 RepID=A0A7C4XLI1_UNCW3